jgi:hypothetical protein
MSGVAAPITPERHPVSNQVLRCMGQEISHENYGHTDYTEHMAACNQCGIEGKKLYHYESSDGKGTLLCKSCHPGMMSSDELAEL